MGPQLLPGVLPALPPPPRCSIAPGGLLKSVPLAVPERCRWGPRFPYLLDNRSLASVGSSHAHVDTLGMALCTALLTHWLKKEFEVITVGSEALGLHYYSISVIQRRYKDRHRREPISTKVETLKILGRN